MDNLQLFILSGFILLATVVVVVYAYIAYKDFQLLNQYRRQNQIRIYTTPPKEVTNGRIKKTN